MPLDERQRAFLYGLLADGVSFSLDDEGTVVVTLPPHADKRLRWRVLRAAMKTEAFEAAVRECFSLESQKGATSYFEERCPQNNGGSHAWMLTRFGDERCWHCSARRKWSGSHETAS